MLKVQSTGHNIAILHCNRKMSVGMKYTVCTILTSIYAQTDMNKTNKFLSDTVSTIDSVKVSIDLVSAIIEPNCVN